MIKQTLRSRLRPDLWLKLISQYALASLGALERDASNAAAKRPLKTVPYAGPYVLGSFLLDISRALGISTEGGNRLSQWKAPRIFLVTRELSYRRFE